MPIEIYRYRGNVEPSVNNNINSVASPYRIMVYLFFPLALQP